MVEVFVPSLSADFDNSLNTEFAPVLIPSSSSLSAAR